MASTVWQGEGLRSLSFGLALVWVPSDEDPEGRLITTRGLCEFTRPYFAGNFYLENSQPELIHRSKEAIN